MLTLEGAESADLARNDSKVRTVQIPKYGQIRTDYSARHPSSYACDVRVLLLN